MMPHRNVAVVRLADVVLAALQHGPAQPVVVSQQLTPLLGRAAALGPVWQIAELLTTQGLLTVEKGFLLQITAAGRQYLRDLELRLHELGLIGAQPHKVIRAEGQAESTDCPSTS